MQRRIHLFALGKTVISADASWLPAAVLLVWTLGDSVFPGLVPGLAPRLYWVMAVAGTLGLFASVVVRESVQGLIAARRGVAVGEIRLCVFGGLVTDREGAAPAPLGQELALAAGALATSLALGAVLLLALFQGAAAGAHLAPGGVAFFLGLANAGVAAANLLPAYPMSGGRLLRAVLTRWTATPSRATRSAAVAGTVLAVAMVAGGGVVAVAGDRAGLHGGLWLAVAGLILWFAGRRALARR